MRSKLTAILVSLAFLIGVPVLTSTTAQASESNIYIKNSPSSDSWLQVCYDGGRCQKINPGKAIYSNYWAPTVGKSFDFNKVTVSLVDSGGSWKQRWDVDEDGYGSCHAIGSSGVTTLTPSNSIDYRVDYLIYDRTSCRH